MLDESISLDEVKRIFEHDRFATETVGCRIVEAGKAHAVCELDITEAHLNANDEVMGGVVYTLADFTAGIASNIGQDPSVSIESTIRFLSTIKGTKLIATCNPVKPGRSLGFFTITVEDDLGTPIADATATMFRVNS